MKHHIWTTQNGEKINVKDMSTSHIINTLKCIEDKRINFIVNLGWFEDNDCQQIEESEEEREMWINIFENELENRKYYF